MSEKTRAEVVATSIADDDLIEIVRIKSGGMKEQITFANLAASIEAGALENIVTVDDASVMTNKTLTEPKIGTATEYVTITVASQTHASPEITIKDIGDDADEFALLQAAQTFSNKTIDTTCTVKLANTAVVNAVAASKVLTVAATPGEGETVTIGSKVYKARLTALGAGVAASAVLTSNNTECTDGVTVTVNDVVYRLITTMAQANDVKRDGTTADTTLANLVHAVNGTGEAGVNYFAGTAQATGVTAGEVTAHAITFTADAVGYAGNLFPKATNEAATLDWDGTGEYFTGGIDAQAANDVFVNSNAENFIINLEKAVEASGAAGTDYGTGTTANADVVISAKNASTATATAKVKGVIGNSIAIAETLSNGGSVWASGATALSGGVDGTVGYANELRADIVNSKLWYCTAANTIADANWIPFTSA